MFSKQLLLFAPSVLCCLGVCRALLHKPLPVHCPLVTDEETVVFSDCKQSGKPPALPPSLFPPHWNRLK